MSQSSKLPLVYSCSGASSAAQMANQIAIKLERLHVAEMSCIAGVGGDVKSLVRTAKSGRPIIALDGCPLHCAAQILKRHGLKPDKHYDLSKLEVEKRQHEDFDPAEAARVFQRILEDPELPRSRRKTNAVAGKPPMRTAIQAEEEPSECASPPCYLSEFSERHSPGNSRR